MYPKYGTLSFWRGVMIIVRISKRLLPKGKEGDCCGTGAVCKGLMKKEMTQEEAVDHQLSTDVSTDAGNQVEAAQSPEIHQKGGTEDADAKVESSNEGVNDADEFAVRFSEAQLKAKIAQAKYEAKLEADAELLAAKKELMERRYDVADRKREKDTAATQCEEMQTRLDARLQEHKKTLTGTRDDLQLEKLLASLNVEKATLKKLQEAFEKQQHTLTMAQERMEDLEMQVANYQKTETVLAQSVSHLQHRFASKDQQRATSVENVQRELMQQHEQDVKTLYEELEISKGTEKMAQEQLQELQKKLKTLRDDAQQALVFQDSVVTREQEITAKIAQLETEKAVLQSKAEQVQKADVQLRSQLHLQSDEIATLRQANKKLQRDNKVLGDVASDLMNLADKKHAAEDGKSERTHDEDGVFLQKRRKRLRRSLDSTLPSFE